MDRNGVYTQGTFTPLVHAHAGRTPGKSTRLTTASQPVRTSFAVLFFTVTLYLSRGDSRIHSGQLAMMD